MLKITIKWNARRKWTPGGGPSSPVVLKPDVREYLAEQEALRAVASSAEETVSPEAAAQEAAAPEQTASGIILGTIPDQTELPDGNGLPAGTQSDGSASAAETYTEAETADPDERIETEPEAEETPKTEPVPEEEDTAAAPADEETAPEGPILLSLGKDLPDAEVTEEEILRYAAEIGEELDGFLTDETSEPAPLLTLSLGVDLPEVEVTEEEILNYAAEIGEELDGLLTHEASEPAPPLAIPLGVDLPDAEVTEEEILRYAAEIGAELDGLLPEECVSPGPPSGRAAELYELWGLSRSPEELEKERRRETFRRRFLAFLKGTAAMLLIAAIGAGVYAYAMGWRINLFYEIASGVPTAEKTEDVLGSFLAQLGLTNVTGEGETDASQKDGPAENIDQATGSGTEERERDFLGITVSNQTDPGELVNEGPAKPLEDPDQVTVEENGPVQTVEVERAMNIYLSVDGSVNEIRVLDGQVKNVGELLDFAGVELENDDFVEPVSATLLNDGDTVRVTRVRYEEYTETEVIPGQAVERMTPCLRPGRTYAINESQKSDGEREVTYLDKYVNGELESHEEIRSEVTKEPTDYILLVGAEITASPINGAQYTDVQILDNVPTEYTAVYSGRCTAYNFKKGSYGASGMFLSQGMVAVDPSLIPYGSLLYITSANGKFVYGWAIAADYCEASAAGIAVVDLFFDTYRESALFGARSLNVYVVTQLYQADLASYIAKEGMFRSRVPA